MLKHLDTIIGAEILIKLTENAKEIADSPDSKVTLALMKTIHTMTECKEDLHKITTDWLDGQADFK